MEAMVLDEMDQDLRQKSGREELERTVQSQISANEQEIRELREEIRAKGQEIRELREETRELRVETRELREELRGVEMELAIASGAEVRSALDARVQFLRQLITSRDQQTLSLREEIKSRDQQLNNLRTSLRSVQADGGLISKRPRLLDKPKLRSFVQSAKRHYRQWEQAEKAVEEAGVEKEGYKKFLVVSADPFANYGDGFLIWVRRCYKDLKEILAKAEASQRFTLLGTAGIGKSMFTLFWICYLATLKEKVVWKFADGLCYLLDFSEQGSLSENAMVYGPFAENEAELGVVYNDPTAWLIIDGRQRFNLDHSCHILLACSAKNENYAEFSNNQFVAFLYISVWAEEEIVEFLNDFEVAKDNYPQMKVPVKEDALGYFAKLGGVPRYVLYSGKTQNRLNQLRRDIKSLEKDTCLKFFTGEFEEERMSDNIVHMKCRDGVYDTYCYDFASPYVKGEFGNCFIKLNKVEVVDFLMVNADNPVVGNAYGFIFELVAHAVMQRGGKFVMKQVGSRGERLRTEPKDEALTLSDDMKVVTFREVKEIELMPNTYYKPSISNFESVDAVVSPDILLQFFSSRRGQHGFKVNGLKRLHEQLNLSKYKLCSCVPEEKYKNTSYQNFLKADKTVYQSKVLDLMDQFVVMVDYSEYKRLS